MLLCKPHWHVVHNLVLRNLVGQGFVYSRLVLGEAGNSSDGLQDFARHESGPVESSSSQSIITVNSPINSVSIESLCNEHTVTNCAIVANHLFDSTDQSRLVSTSLENGDSIDQVVSGRALNTDHHKETVFQEVPSTVISLEQQVVSLDRQDVSSVDVGGLCSRQTSNLSFSSDRSVDDDHDDVSPLEIGNEVSVQQLVYMLVFLIHVNIGISTFSTIWRNEYTTLKALN